MQFCAADSRHSLIGLSACIRCLPHPNLLLRQPILFIHQHVNLLADALDHGTNEKPQETRNAFARIASFRIIRGPNHPHHQQAVPQSDATFMISATSM
jgi:hypothetical protein